MNARMGRSPLCFTLVYAALFSLLAQSVTTAATWAQNGSVPASGAAELKNESAARDLAVYALSPELQAVEGFDPAESAGLFVGIRIFEDNRLAEIPFAVDDAIDLAHLFALELKLLDPPKIILCLSGNPQKPASKERLERLRQAGAEVGTATQVQIYDQLEKQRQATGAKGIFITTVATHGFSDQGADFLVCSDSRLRRIERTGIAVNDVLDDIALTQAPRRLLLLDACRERLTSATRSGLADEAAAMSPALSQAIANASGMVVLMGTTLGGYAYDDYEQRNGVFTAALLEGCRGAAPADDQGLISAQSLVAYVNDKVQSWVQANRPEHAQVSQGISSHFEGAAAHMPLAANPALRQKIQIYHSRRDAALNRLRNHIDGSIISGALYDEMARALSPASPHPDRLALIGEIEILDQGERTKRNLAFFFSRHKDQLMVLVGSEPIQLEKGHLKVRVNAVDAQVFVDQHFYGQAQPDAPLNIENLPVGDRLVAIAAKGYKSSERRIAITREQWREIAVELHSLKEEPSATADKSPGERSHLPPPF